jgi:hypothetical protein
MSIVKALPYMRIRAINNDLHYWVKQTNRKTISGGGLHIIYRQNGVQSPFDESKVYQIFIKKDKVLVCEKIAA